MTKTLTDLKSQLLTEMVAETLQSKRPLQTTTHDFNYRAGRCSKCGLSAKAYMATRYLLQEALPSPFMPCGDHDTMQKQVELATYALLTNS